MAKRNVTAEVTAYFKENIDSRIATLKEEIVALKAVRHRMFPGHPHTPTKKKSTRKKKTTPKRKLSPAHKQALAKGRAEWAARQKKAAA